ncbi:unnamed protein product [Discula destructiva]
MTENNPNNTKQNPARRGRGGRGGRNRGRKNYASEGDALTDMPTPVGSSPATPVKLHTGSPASAFQPAQPRSTNNKKNSAKPRPSNVSTSLSATEPSQRTPPATGAVTTRLGLASSSSAFASSSSFHSPAPNTLPRPVFSQFTTKSETLIRPRSESVNVQQAKESSPTSSDSETPSPFQQQNGIQIKQETHEFSFQQGFDAERERIRRANSANAAVPFSAPSRSQPFQLNDNPIPFVLPRRPAQRGVSDHSGASGSATPSDAFGRPIRQSLPPATPSQPYTLATQAQATRNNMQPFSHNEQISAAHSQTRYFSPQHAQAQAAQRPVQHLSPQHTPAHLAQHHQLATPPQLDPSEEVKKLLWGPPTPSSQMGPVSAPVSSNILQTSSSASAPPSGPHLRGGPLDPMTSGSNSVGQDNRKSLAEDALRKVLGLNFPLSMSSGLDGNRSPQGRFARHA